MGNEVVPPAESAVRLVAAGVVRIPAGLVRAGKTAPDDVAPGGDRSEVIKDTTSPFNPGKPVDLELFVGRLPEIERLRAKARAAMTGRLEAAFITGERGIGKSSLASFVGHLCEKHDGALSVHVMLGGIDTLENVVRAVFDQLVKNSTERPFLDRVKEFLGNRVTEAGLFGVSIKFEPQEEDLRVLVNNFVPSIAALTEQLRPDRDGLVIILDDLNGIVQSPRFADWIKSFVDEVSTSQRRVPLCLVLVGLEERRHMMIEQNPSVGRIFEVIDVRPWDRDETRIFYANAFAKVGIAVEDSAWPVLQDYTGGLPALAHEIGDAAFRVDEDGLVDKADALKAVVLAADVVGSKYLEPQVIRAIRSKKYRDILRKLALTRAFGGRELASFSRAELKKISHDSEKKVVDSFLRRMKSLDVIVEAPEEGRGRYRFARQLDCLYFVMEGIKASKRGGDEDKD
ncbi:MAG: ATP-binding protein [Planctomycetota bacterium]|nr:MAG: ATP-binding protein [Planctomycetota bacterium]